MVSWGNVSRRGIRPAAPSSLMPKRSAPLATFLEYSGSRPTQKTIGFVRPVGDCRRSTRSQGGASGAIVTLSVTTSERLGTARPRAKVWSCPMIRAIGSSSALAQAGCVAAGTAAPGERPLPGPLACFRSRSCLRFSRSSSTCFCGRGPW